VVKERLQKSIGLPSVGDMMKYLHSQHCLECLEDVVWPFRWSIWSHSGVGISWQWVRSQKCESGWTL